VPFIFLLLSLCLCGSRGTLAQTSVNLPEILKSAETPADALARDPVVPSMNLKYENDSPSGSIDDTIRNDIPAPLTTYGTGPGSLSQFRGLGKSAEDIDVQALGISLNPPQGGGFSLSVFPQFLWADLSYQLGPSLAGIDPQSVSGSITLIPWSARHLELLGSHQNASGFYSTQGVAQFAAGSSHEQDYAAITGYSVGALRGPSAGASTAWKWGSVTAHAHVLATSVDGDLSGTIAMPTPNEDLLTQRVIPIVQFDFPLAREAVLKTSAFYDGSLIRDQDSSKGTVSNSFIQQFGAENALLFGPWKMGASLRALTYHADLATAPIQLVSNFQITRDIEVEKFLIEPSLQAVVVTDQGVLPGASLGVRREEGNLAFFSRSTVSHKTGNLLQRYAQDAFSLANPTLGAETDYSQILGTEIGDAQNGVTFEALGQRRSNVQVYTLLPSGQSMVTNQGNASILALTASGVLQASSFFSFRNAFTLNTSQIDQTQNAFPYLPTLLNNFSAAVHQNKVEVRLEWLLSTQAYVSSFSGSLPGYGLVNLALKTKVSRQLKTGVRMDNMIDHGIQWVPGYPYQGRSFSLFLSGDLE